MGNAIKTYLAAPTRSVTIDDCCVLTMYSREFCKTQNKRRNWTRAASQWRLTDRFINGSRATCKEEVFGSKYASVNSAPVRPVDLIDWTLNGFCLPC